MKPSHPWRSAVVAAVVSLALPAFGAATDAETIEQTAATWSDLYRNGDARELAELYTVDARLLPPNQESVTGRQAIAQQFEAAMNAGVAEIETETEEIEVAGSLAYRVASYRVLGPGRDILDRGKVLEIWHRKEGRWELHRDIWNSNLPAPGGGGEDSGGSP